MANGAKESPPLLADNGTDWYVSSDHALLPGDAVSALILLEDGRYLCQLRDQRPEIFFPGHWGLFGGAIEDHETRLGALRRELKEELGLAQFQATHFTDFEFDLTAVGHRKIFRAYYLIRLNEETAAGLELGEGHAMQAFEPAEILTLQRVIPYDAFALWLHINGARIGAGVAASRS